MAKRRPALRAELTPPARQDIRGILQWSEENFGKAAALRYEALLIQAVRDIEADPAQPGVMDRYDLPNGTRLYHLASSRDRVAGDKVVTPRHFLAYRINESRIEVLRVLHDSRDLARQLPV